MKDWPYPKWIAHRGAGKLAPENTLAAFELGAKHGYRMFECDAKLSLDGIVFCYTTPSSSEPLMAVAWLANGNGPGYRNWTRAVGTLRTTPVKNYLR